MNELNGQKLFQGLVCNLIKSAIVDEENPCETEKRFACGWGRESNYSLCSSTNTSEALLGLIHARGMIYNNQFGEYSPNMKVTTALLDKYVEGGIRFTLESQCSTGGWTTSSFMQKKAKGNIITTTLSIWALTSHAFVYADNPLRFYTSLFKANNFIFTCRSNATSDYRCRPESSHNNQLSKTYAFLSLALLVSYYVKNRIYDDDALSIIKKNLNEIILLMNDANIDSALSSFSVIDVLYYFLGVRIVKSYMRCVEKYIDDDIRQLVNELGAKLEKIIYTLKPAVYENSFSTSIDRGEDGKSNSFSFFVPVWALVALNYCGDFQVDYEDLIMNLLVTKYIELDQDYDVNVVDGEGRQWVWAVAQLLFALSLYLNSRTMRSLENSINSKKNVNKIFIAYGRNSKLLDAIISALESIGLEVSLYNNNSGNTNSTYSAVKYAVENSSVSIILLSGDDKAKCRREFFQKGDVDERRLKVQARQNVVFEAGYSYAFRGDKRTIIVAEKGVKIFTDINSINRIELATNIRSKKKREKSFTESIGALVESLVACGCTIHSQSVEQATTTASAVFLNKMAN